MAVAAAIENLPDFPAIQQIQRALWERAEIRGAAVFVGAGLSRNALLASPTSRRPPLWKHLRDAMGERLYPRGNAPLDPLRLAEEYKAELGPAAVEALINELVPDIEWQPGPLHAQLLNLPWKDVLTTNWDTLLERASSRTDQQRYSIVRTIEDIPRTRSPRIIKLHGSLPSHRPLIFTEEDYRTYPKRFAPFVNLAQQVLLENELCLLGFSGDDPNFLQWSGWIRDELGAAARRIYLVGALDLSSSHRKLLVARNVSPVDLAPLVRDLDDEEARHVMASKLFLDFLKSCKPKLRAEWLSDGDWATSNRLLTALPPGAQANAAPDALRQAIPVWRKEREAYPGWLICPSTQRRLLRLNSGHIEQVLKRGFSQLSAREQSEVLYEAMWRLDLSFAPVSPWLKGLLREAVEDKTAKLTEHQRCDLAVIMLRMAREDQDRALFDHWCQFLSGAEHSNEDVLAEVAYQSSLWARDHLDFLSLSKLLKGIRGLDPIWKTRQAGLFYELGDSETAARVAMDAWQELRDRYRLDPDSIWVISRLAWALFLVRAGRPDSSQPDDNEPLASSNEWQDHYRNNKCLPWDELDALDSQLSAAWEKTTEGSGLRPQFDQGRYTRLVSFSDAIPFVQHDTRRIGDLTGMPTRLCAHGRSVEVMRRRLSRALELSENHSEGELLRSILALTTSSDGLMRKAFDSLGVAKISVSTAESLIRVLLEAISFGLSQLAAFESGGQATAEDCWVERLAVLLEVSSRLAVRLPSEKAIVLFGSALDLANSPILGPKRWRLFEPLGNLLRRSLSAIAPSDRASVLLGILSLPLPDEKGIRVPDGSPSPANEWPELMMNLAPILGRSANEAVFAARVNTLISKVGASDFLTQQRALMRIAFLSRVGTLIPTEAAAVGVALQRVLDSEAGRPFVSLFFPDMLFLSSGVDKEKAETIFRNTVLRPCLQGFGNPEYLRAVLNATATLKNGSRYFKLSNDEALKAFDTAMDWTPIAIDPNLDSRIPDTAELTGWLLADTVLPVLDAKTLGDNRIDRLFHRIQQSTIFFDSLLLALPIVVGLDPSREESAVELVRLSFLTQDRDKAGWALAAISRWCSLKRPPEQLTRSVILHVMAGRGPWLSSSLAVAIRLLEAGYLTPADLQDLLRALDFLRVETAYSSWNREDSRTGTLALIRARCVQLSAKLQTLGMAHSALNTWISSAKDDAFPEVRYALDSAPQR